MASSFHLTIGEVAKRAGVTVRALHHYDSLGLVSPSARSDAGYRLYGAEDIARLHAVQSLKQLGLSLEAISMTLAGGGISPQELVARQVAEATRRLEETRVLKEKLQFLQEALSGGDAGATDLLEGIRLLETHRLFLPDAAVRQMLGRWRRARPRWQPIADALQDCRSAAMPVDAPEVQRLAQRWMNVAMQVFHGRLALILDWAHMHREAPETAWHVGLDPALMEYLEQAIGLRMTALKRHLSDDELKRLDGSMGPAWEAYSEECAGVARKVSRTGCSNHWGRPSACHQIGDGLRERAHLGARAFHHSGSARFSGENSRLTLT